MSNNNNSGSAIADLCINAAPFISGDTIRVGYEIQAFDRDSALERAHDITLEQTVELPDSLIPESPIRDGIMGKLTGLDQIAEGKSYLANIEFSVETASAELTQLLNVIYGNISIKSGVRIRSLNFSERYLGNFRGPRFGVDGIRKLVAVAHRPLLCTALKPMGLSAEALASLAHRFAIGGMDIIKDDHGLANQIFAPFEERVKLCSEAVARANRETGRNALYFPSLNAPAHLVLSRAKLAKELGAGGFLITPGIVGFDIVRMIADDDSIALPLMAHPAFQGSFVTSPVDGIDHGILFGTLLRLAGADATVYPNHGGRFSFSVEECRGIARKSIEPLGMLKPIFPVPAGGMTLDKVPAMKKLYGDDVILLMGGGLYSAGTDLVESCRALVKSVI